LLSDFTHNIISTYPITFPYIFQSQTITQVIQHYIKFQAYNYASVILFVDIINLLNSLCYCCLFNPMINFVTFSSLIVLIDYLIKKVVFIMNVCVILMLKIYFAVIIFFIKIEFLVIDTSVMRIVHSGYKISLFIINC
jgi:hypothetical protein